MKIRFSTLEKNPLARFIFQFIGHCQVVLDTGTVLEFTRGSGLFATSIHYPGSLTTDEQKQADKLYEM